MKYFLFVAALFLAACSNDEVDTTGPEITLITPASGDEFHVGEAIEFEAKFTDDVELKSYRVNIHFNDGHEHKSAHDEEWEYNNSWDFEKGKNSIEVKHSEIVIDEHAEHGEYHLGVYCIDAAGNETSVFIPIEIEGDHDDEDH